MTIFTDERGAGYVLYTEPDGTEQIAYLADIGEPQPGDVIVLNGRYTGVKSGTRAVIDGSHYRWDFEDGKGPVVLAVFAASAFRGTSHRGQSDDSLYVSCSGGPCPFVPIAELTYAGTTAHIFWRWKDWPRKDGGEHYTHTVNLWIWNKP